MQRLMRHTSNAPWDTILMEKDAKLSVRGLNTSHLMLQTNSQPVPIPSTSMAQVSTAPLALLIRLAINCHAWTEHVQRALRLSSQPQESARSGITLQATTAGSALKAPSAPLHLRVLQLPVPLVPIQDRVIPNAMRAHLALNARI